MAHFARIDDNGVVQEVIVIDNSVAPDPAPENSESSGRTFIRDILGLPGTWVQTSYNHSFRGSYAGIGYIYRADDDEFTTPSPFPSWSWSSVEKVWVPPVPYPDSDDYFFCNEEKLAWVPL